MDIQEISATQFNVYPSQILYILELKARGVDALIKATTKINMDFDQTIKQTLQLLAPPGTKQMVVDVACSLAITHATQKGGLLGRGAGVISAAAAFCQVECM